MISTFTTETSFTKKDAGTFVAKDRWEKRVQRNNQIEKEQNQVDKLFLKVKGNLEEIIEDFGESL